MRKIQFLLCFGIFAFLFCSCDLPGGSDGGGSVVIDNPTNVQPRKFWAQNLKTESFYQVDAVLLAESPNCRVWAERGAGVSTAMATAMAREYEDNILPKMLNTFSYNGPIGFNGMEIGPIANIKDGMVIANNTMELAGRLVGGDGKLAILLLDIVDGFKPRENEMYCAGYFWAANFYENNPSHQYLKYSNESSMIYIDIYPGNPGSVESCTTFAHELQHLMSFVNAFISNKKYTLDTWIDEGLSSAAEWLYLGEQVKSKVNDYNSDISGLIQKGNNFFVWDNRGSESQYAVLDDYSTVYLFFQWLRLQSGNTKIYNEITLSKNHDYTAVSEAADKAMGGNGYADWETLLKTWLAANYINAPTGPYGYRNDGTLKNIRAKTMPAGIKNILLAPGEGVYSITNNYNLPENRLNIHYTALNKAGNTISDSDTYSGGALLTFNANSNIEGKTEGGTTTGVASYAEAYNDAPGRSALGASFSGPFAIGAQDMLRRNGFDNGPFLDLPRLKKGTALFE